MISLSGRKFIDSENIRDVQLEAEDRGSAIHDDGSDLFLEDARRMFGALNVACSYAAVSLSRMVSR